MANDPFENHPPEFIEQHLTGITVYKQPARGVSVFRKLTSLTIQPATASPVAVSISPVIAPLVGISSVKGGSTPSE